MGMVWSGRHGITVHSHVASNTALSAIYRGVSRLDWLGQKGARDCRCIMIVSRLQTPDS